jgi:hypothetical protein
MKKTKSGNISLPPPALNKEQIAFIERVANIGMVSMAAILRQVISNFIDQPEDAIVGYVQRDYGETMPSVNIYCPPATATALDALAEKFEQPRTQIVRAAVQMYMDKQ